MFCQALTRKRHLPVAPWVPDKEVCMWRLKLGRSWRFASKDILRAAGLPCLPADNEGVAAKLAKVRDGKPLAPVMLVRPKTVHW
jgi:hypothetical protein